MNRILWLLLFTVAIFNTGCGQDSLLPPANIELIPLFSSDLSNVTTSVSSNRLSIKVANVTNNGIYFSLPLGVTGILQEQWTGDSRLLHLAIPYHDRLDIGIFPLSNYNGGEVSAVFELSRLNRQASDPPLGLQNKVTDLTVTEMPSGQVRLEWTEVNIGDYNVDGIVDFHDVGPVGWYFGKTSNDDAWDEAHVADGDKDGRVSLSDLNRIGANYYSEISGYVIKHGAPGTPPPLSVITPQPLDRRDPAFTNWPDPPHYFYETEGSFDDEWAVAPVDSYGVEGIGSDDLAVERIDVFSSLSYSGSPLWLIDGSAQGQLSLGGYIMRIIDPGDWPSRTPIVPPIEGPLGIMFFDNLPRQTRLMLDFVYAPVVDPATGDPAPYTTQLITSVPFALPASDQQLQLSADIQLIPNAGPGPAYWLDSFITQDILGQQVLRHNRLDMASFTVASDTTGDGGFGDEAWLFDSDRDSVSDALLLRQQEYNAYDVTGAGELQAVQLRATATFYSMSDGKLVLGNDAEYYDAQAALWAPLPDAPVLLRFSEQTNFAELVNPGPNQFVRNFDPSTLLAGDEVIIYGYRLVDPTTLLDFHYWGDRILRKVVQ